MRIRWIQDYNAIIRVEAKRNKLPIRASERLVTERIHGEGYDLTSDIIQGTGLQIGRAHV